MNKTLKAVSLAVALIIGLATSGPSWAYPSGSGEVASNWGVVTGSQAKTVITVRGIASGSPSERIQISVTNPQGFSRSLFSVRTSQSGEFRFKVGGLKWRPGTYTITLSSGDLEQSLGFFVSSKRVRG